MNRHQLPGEENASALAALIARSQGAANGWLASMLAEGLTRDRYHRYLSMQYHLTLGVQRHFFQVASFSGLARIPGFREYLIQFGREEEFHFRMALEDLRALGLEPLECPLDVQLWWLYWDAIIPRYPLRRLGATCILENLLGSSSDLLDRLLLTASYLDRENTSFLRVHRHDESAPHGDEVVRKVTPLLGDPDFGGQLIDGARTAATFTSRLLAWIATGMVESEHR